MTATTPKKKGTKAQATTEVPVEPIATGAVESAAATPTAKKKQIIFSKAGKEEKSAYYLFGDIAVEVAGLLDMTVAMSKKEQPMLSISAVQFPLMKAEIEGAGYAVAVSDAVNKPVAEIRVFEGKERAGANLFGEPAQIVANGLGLQAKMSRKNEPYITLTMAQVDEAVAVLEKDRAYQPRVLREALVITSPGRFCLLREAAEVASEYFQIALEQSQAGNPKLNLAPTQYEEVRPVLKRAGYYTKEVSSAELDRNRSQAELSQ